MPENPQTLIDLVTLVRDNIPPKGGPIVAHCRFDRSYRIYTTISLLLSPVIKLSDAGLYVTNIIVKWDTWDNYWDIVS